MNPDQMHYEMQEEWDEPAYQEIVQGIAEREREFEDGNHKNCHRAIEKYSLHVQRLQKVLDLADYLADVVGMELRYDYYNRSIMEALRTFRTGRKAVP